MTRIIINGILGCLLLIGTAQAIVLDGAKVSEDFDYAYEANALPQDTNPTWTRVQAGDCLESVNDGSVER